MDPTLFYSPGACSLAAMVALEWAEQPYRLSRVDREVRASDVYKRINPLAQVPALKLGERVLTENAAVLAHIADRRPDLQLLPAPGTPERDRATQWLSYFGSNFHASFYPWFNPQRFIKDESLRPAVKEAAVENIRARLAYVDQALAGQRYVMGDRSVLDAYLYAMSRWANKIVDVPKDYPNVAAHQMRMELDPAVQFALATERGEPGTSPSGKLLGTVDVNSA
jgi:glutathione S-transferase